MGQTRLVSTEELKTTYSDSVGPFVYICPQFRCEFRKESSSFSIICTIFPVIVRYAVRTWKFCKRLRAFCCRSRVVSTLFLKAIDWICNRYSVNLNDLHVHPRKVCVHECWDSSKSVGHPKYIKHHQTTSALNFGRLRTSVQFSNSKFFADASLFCHFGLHRWWVLFRSI